MRTPQQLARRELLAIVDGLQQTLYLDLDSQQIKFWNPEKEWDGGEICDRLAALLAEHDLVPQMPTAVDDAPLSPGHRP